MEVKHIKYIVLGKEIESLILHPLGGHELLSPGTYEVEWSIGFHPENGSDYPSGVYLYKLQTESFSETKKMILIK